MTIKVRRLGVQDYTTCLHAMQAFTQQRNKETADELWIVEHLPVFTQGLNGKAAHILHTTHIPILQSDRGGQVTYHAEGQLIVYTLIDIVRSGITIRELVSILEHAMIIALGQYGLHATAREDAPGVYIHDKKIGSVGLRVKKGCSYHGLSLNNALDLTPFKMINPCGYPNLAVTQLADLDVRIQTHELAIPVVHAIMNALENH